MTAHAALAFLFADFNRTPQRSPASWLRRRRFQHPNSLTDTSSSNNLIGNGSYSSRATRGRRRPFSFYFQANLFQPQLSPLGSWALSLHTHGAFLHAARQAPLVRFVLSQSTGRVPTLRRLWLVNSTLGAMPRAGLPETSKPRDIMAESVFNNHGAGRHIDSYRDLVAERSE